MHRTLTVIWYTGIQMYSIPKDHEYLAISMEHFTQIRYIPSLFLTKKPVDSWRYHTDI